MSLQRLESETFTSNVYLLKKASSRDAFLFDIGEYEKLQDELSGFDVKALFLTHCHYDHIYFIQKLVEEFPEVQICGHPITLEALNDSKMNLSFYHEDPIRFHGGNRLEIGDNSQSEGAVHFDALQVNWFYTPGHHPGCITYQVGDFIITGDSFIPGIPTVTKLKGGDRKEAEISKASILKKVKEENLIVAPGHGAMMDLDEVLEAERLMLNETISKKRSLVNRGE